MNFLTQWMKKILLIKNFQNFDEKSENVNIEENYSNLSSEKNFLLKTLIHMKIIKFLMTIIIIP